MAFHEVVAMARNRGKSPGEGYAGCPRQWMMSARLGTIG